MNTPFKWQNFDHFYNTVRKRTRDQLGDGFEFEELKSICSFLFELSNKLDLDKYLDPTGMFISKIKQIRAPKDYLSMMKQYQSISSKDDIDYFIGKLAKQEKMTRSLDAFTTFFRKKKKYIFKPSELIPKEPGLYFLYNEKKELIYIGKSINLSSRAYSSYLERNAKYIKVMLTKTKADAHIFEPYCISIYAPLYNAEFKTRDRPTFELELPLLSDFIILECDVLDIEADYKSSVL